MLEQRQQRNVADLHDLELHSGNISYSLALASLSNNEGFVVDLNKVQAAVPGHKSSDLLGVLDQLDTGAFTDGRVGLFRFNTTTQVRGRNKEKEFKRHAQSDILSSFPNSFNNIQGDSVVPIRSHHFEASCGEEKGRVDVTYIFSRTIPLAWDAPPKGLCLKAVPRIRFLYCLSAQRLSLRSFWSLRPALRPLGWFLPGREKERVRWSDCKG